MKELIAKNIVMNGFEKIIPLFPNNIYEDEQKYLISPSIINQNPTDTEYIINQYLKDIDTLWNSILNNSEQKLKIVGGFPILTSEESNYICKSSAFIKLLLHQTELNYNDSRWLTEEQIHKYDLVLKEKSEPILILWKRKNSNHKYDLFYTRLYNVENIEKFYLPEDIIFPINEINWEYRLSELMNEYEISYISKTNIVSKNGIIYRNETFLSGTDDNYSLISPLLKNFDDYVTLQQFLISLSIIIFITKLKSTNLSFANQLGYILGSVLINLTMPNPAYQGSIYHKNHADVNLSQLIPFIDDFIDALLNDIFEIGYFISNSVMLDRRFYNWMVTESNYKKLKRKLDLGNFSKPSNAEDASKNIRRNNFDVKSAFLEDLIVCLKQEAITIFDDLPEYQNTIINQLQKVFSERDIELYPDDYEYYILIKTHLLNAIVSKLKIAEDLNVFWINFENSILNSESPDPKKDNIIKNKAGEYKIFLKDILFSKANPEIIYEECKKILKLEEGNNV